MLNHRPWAAPVQKQQRAGRPFCADQPEVHGAEQVGRCLGDGVQQLFGVVPPSDSPRPLYLPASGHLDHGVAGVRREHLVQQPEHERRREDVCKPYGSLSLLAFMRHSDDAEFFHPAAERVRVEAQDLRRAARSVDDPTRLLKGGQDVVSRAGFQAFQRRSRSSACGRRLVTFGADGVGGSAVAGRAAAAEANTSGSISSVGPFDRMTARSRTFSSSRTFPGQG